MDTIRTLPNCTAILGNGDMGVISVGEANPRYCELEQMLPNYWTYWNLSGQNLDYLKSLPKSADIMLSGGKTVHLSHTISLIHHKPRLGAFHSSDYARKMELSPFTFEEGIRDMQKAAEEYSNEVSEYPGDICLFGHNHLQYLGNVAGKILLNPGSCGLLADYDVRAPYALLYDEGIDVRIELHRVEYDVEETIRAVLDFNGFPHARFWGNLRAAALKLGSDIPIHRFWQRAREIGGGIFPMENDLWRKTIAAFKFDHNWSVDDWRRYGAKYDVIRHYDALVDENNDPARDPEQAQAYMDKWDGERFIEAMWLNPDKSVLGIGVGTGRLALRVCDKCGSFTGIDISPKTIERAKENLREFSNAFLICGDYLTHQFDEFFDVIYSSLTFMHIEDKQAAVEKAANLLASNGRFVLSIDKNQQTIIEYGNRKLPVYPDNPGKILTLLIESGLTVEKQFETDFAVVFVAQKA
jgi:SAM-dependent methyltransferase/predicted phosphodiesterase